MKKKAHGIKPAIFFLVSVSVCVCVCVVFFFIGVIYIYIYIFIIIYVCNYMHHSVQTLMQWSLIYCKLIRS